MLNERSTQILLALVESYIERPGPVGSRYLTRKYGFSFSPATVRNIMADLEEMGYLVQPHTSAGRVPSDKGFRLYVDYLSRGKLYTAERYMDELRNAVEWLRSDVNDLLREATRALAAMSHYVVFAEPVRCDNTTLNRIELFRYRGNQIVAVLLGNEGLVRSRILDVDFGLTQKELNSISEYLNSEFSGYTIDEVRRELVRQMSKEKTICDILISKAMDLCREAITFPMAEMIVSGLPELLGLPEFSDRINEIARAIEDKNRIMDILDGLADSDEDVHVIIGSEIPEEQMRGLSIVSASYKEGQRPLGRVGIIGPTRMDYSQAIPMVRQAARLITLTLSRE
ncbi:MAG: heat-inducible transcriptional repressor HrcA [Nitrospirota bacterium]|jgi:heat-inducible transcriptional repressor